MSFTSKTKPTPVPDGTLSLPRERGRELQWPQPWPGINAGWYESAREHRPAHPDQAAAIRELLRDPLNSGAYYYAIDLADEVAMAAGASVTAARKALIAMPDAALPEVNVWCGNSAADGWMSFRNRVFDVVRSDAATAFEDVQQALPMDAEPSIYAALMALMMQGRIVALRETPGHGPGPFYIRSRRGGDQADYTDLMPSTAQAA